MEESLTKLKNRFPTLPKDVLRKIYSYRLERMKAFKRLGLLEDVRWIIEAKVCISSEIHESLIETMPGIGRSSYSKKRRAKRMNVCHKCARWTCDKRYRSKGMVSINREDKIQFIKDRLSKESLDDIVQTLETHSSGDVHAILLDLMKIFNKEKERYCLRNLTLKDHIC